MAYLEELLPVESGILHTIIYAVDERRFFQKLNLWNKKFNVKFEA